MYIVACGNDRSGTRLVVKECELAKVAPALNIPLWRPIDNNIASTTLQDIKLLAGVSLLDDGLTPCKRLGLQSISNRRPLILVKRR